MLVLLHGMNGGADQFESAFTDRHLDGFGLLALDLPGFGHSQPPTGSASLDDIAKPLATAIIEGTAGRPHCIVAHSFSGALAHRTRSNTATPVVLLEGNLVADHLDFSSRILSFTRSDFASEHARLQRAAHMILKGQIKTPLADTQLRRLAAAWQQCEATTVWDAADSCARDVRSGDVLSSYRRVAPLLCLYGTSSRYAAGVDALARALPNAEFASVAGAGHYPWLDRPEETWSAIARFAQRHCHQTGLTQHA